MHETKHNLDSHFSLINCVNYISINSSREGNAAMSLSNEVAS